MWAETKKFAQKKGSCFDSCPTGAKIGRNSGCWAAHIQGQSGGRAPRHHSSLHRHRTPTTAAARPSYGAPDRDKDHANTGSKTEKSRGAAAGAPALA